MIEYFLAALFCVCLLQLSHQYITTPSNKYKTNLRSAVQQITTTSPVCMRIQKSLSRSKLDVLYGDSYQSRGGNSQANMDTRTIVLAELVQRFAQVYNITEEDVMTCLQVRKTLSAPRPGKT